MGRRWKGPLTRSFGRISWLHEENDWGKKNPMKTKAGWLNRAAGNKQEKKKGEEEFCLYCAKRRSRRTLLFEGDRGGSCRSAERNMIEGGPEG